MQNDRKEPVIDKDVYQLTDRVRLTWRDARELSQETPPAPQPVSPAAVSKPAADPQSAPAAQSRTEPKTPAATLRAPLTVPPQNPEDAPRQGILSEEQTAELVKRLSAEIEATVRQTISETLELSLTNAISRVRYDIDRSLQSIISAAVNREVSNFNKDKNL